MRDKNHFFFLNIEKVLCLQTKIVILTKFASINLKDLFKTLNKFLRFKSYNNFLYYCVLEYYVRVDGLAENIVLRSIISCHLLSPKMHTILSKHIYKLKCLGNPLPVLCNRPQYLVPSHLVFLLCLPPFFSARTYLI